MSLVQGHLLRIGGMKRFSAQLCFSVSFSCGLASPNPDLELSFKGMRQVKPLWVLA